ITLSFLASPPLINLGYRLSDRLGAGPVDKLPPTPIAAASVVVAGYGPVGRVLCAMLERARIPYTAFDVDMESLDKGKRGGHNVHYGDPTDAELLDAISIARARLVIVAMSDLVATKRLLGNLRHFYPGVPTTIAVQYLAYRDELRRMGETHVVALAPEGTMSFGHSVLDMLGVANAETEAIIGSLKAKDYGALRVAGDVEVPPSATA